MLSLTELHILHLLAKQASYGYALRTEMPQISLSGIYVALHNLERLDLCEQQTKYTQTGPAQRMYRATRKGKRLLSKITQQEMHKQEIRLRDLLTHYHSLRSDLTRVRVLHLASGGSQTHIPSQ